jgi:hypothetical protein
MYFCKFVMEYFRGCKGRGPVFLLYSIICVLNLLFSQLSRLRVGGYFSCPPWRKKGGGVTQIRRQQANAGPLSSLPLHSLNVLYCPFKFLNTSSKTGLENQQFLHVLDCPFLLLTTVTRDYI